jgi:peptidoglycan/LPS O-acetylase OafA/YrhL
MLAVIVWNRKLPVIIALLAVTSFAAGVFFIGQYESAVFYMPVTRLWELLAGAWLAWRERRHLHAALGAATDLPARAREIFSPLGLAVLLACDFAMNSGLPFPGWWALPSVFGTMMVIAAGSDAWINRHLLAHPVIVFVGLISYPLYLWHWPILSFIRISSGAEPSTVTAMAAVLCAILLAWLTYQFVEKPIRGRQTPARGRALVAILLGCAGVVAAASLFAFIDGGMPERFSPALRPFLTFDYMSRANKSWKDGVCFLAPTQATST